MHMHGNVETQVEHQAGTGHAIHMKQQFHMKCSHLASGILNLLVDRLPPADAKSGCIP
jgi:hypothetical protein